MSATSWTPDEDFDLLLAALCLYDHTAAAVQLVSKLPKLVVVITGKGADRADFENKVRVLEAGWKFVQVRTAWLAMEDYPKLLGELCFG